MLLTDLGIYLEQQQVGKRGVDLFLGTRPEDPEQLLAIHEYPGQAPEYQNDGSTPGPSREHPQVQVMGRGRDYEMVRAMVQLAWVALSRVTNQVINGTRYLEIRPSSSPALIGRDASDRVLIGFNASVHKEV